MASYQVTWKASTRVATIQAKSDALPAGAVKIGEFEHDDAQDGFGASNINENHVFYHHVRDALYKVGEQNMQTVSIEQDTTYVAVTGITRTSAASATVAVGGTYQFTQTIAPGGASNTKVLYTSSNPARATVNANGLVTGVATGAPATITVTTEDGGFTATAAINVSNVFEQPSLAALTLSDSQVNQGQAVTVNIIGATAGSVLTSTALPAGLTLNSAARTITGTPTTVAGPLSITLTETLTDSANSPRPSSVSLEVVATPPSPAAATLFPAFADPGSSGIWADLTVAQRAQRQLVADEMSANGWLVDPDSVTFDDTVTITSASQLDTWLNGTAVGGVTRNVARNQRVLLDPAGTWTYANDALIDRARGLDWLASGKMLLIDGQGTDIRTRLQFSGSRGIFWRNTRFSILQSDIGGDTTWSPGAVTVNVTNGGTGFQVGQALTVVTRGASVYTDPVLTVASIGAGGAITAVTVSNRGMMTGTSAITVSSATSTGNATLSCVPGTNIRDTNMIFINRSSSFPLLSVVTFADCEFGGGYRTSDATQWMVCVAGDNCEQIALLRCSFNGFQTAFKAPTVRRIIVHECDGQQQIGDWTITLNTRVNTSTVGPTYASIYPDGLVYHWFSRNTVRRPFDDVNLVNSAGHDMGIDQEHSDPAQWGTSGDTGGYQVWRELNAFYLPRTGAKFRAAKSLTYYAGTQGPYLDDTSFRIDNGVYGDFLAIIATNAINAFNGVTEVGRTTAVRVGALGPSGSNANNSTPTAVAKKLFGTSHPGELNLVKCVVGATSTPSSGTSYSAGTINQTANVIADPAVAGDYAAKFPGTFTTDGEGRTVYTLDDSGTRAAFRAALWAHFGRAGEGFFNPASWG